MVRLIAELVEIVRFESTRLLLLFVLAFLVLISDGWLVRADVIGRTLSVRWSDKLILVRRNTFDASN